MIKSGHNTDMDQMSGIKAVFFDFGDVVGRVRMAVAGEPGEGWYKVDLIDDVVDAIDRLRKSGRRVALVTNNDRREFTRIAPDLDLDAMFDVVIFSSDVGVAKPGARIFLHAMKEVGVDPDESLFIDDLAKNVDAAVTLGMHGVVADSTAAVVDAVEALLSRDSS